MVEPLPSKQITRVRFPSSAPRRGPGPNRSGALAFPHPYNAETAGGAYGRTNASSARHPDPPGHPSGVGGVLVRERIAQRPLLNGDLRAVDQDDETGLRVKMCVWLGVSRGLDLAFLNAD